MQISPWSALNQLLLFRQVQLCRGSTACQVLYVFSWDTEWHMHCLFTSPPLPPPPHLVVLQVADAATLSTLHNSEGCTLQVHQPQRFFDPCWRLLAALERELGCLVGTNA